jgi:hypothetical protein
MTISRSNPDQIHAAIAVDATQLSDGFYIFTETRKDALKQGRSHCNRAFYQSSAHNYSTMSSLCLVNY